MIDSPLQYVRLLLEIARTKEAIYTGQQSLSSIPSLRHCGVNIYVQKYDFGVPVLSEFMNISK